MKMFKGHRSLDLLVMVWAFLMGFLFLCQRGWTLNLHADAPTVYSGPTGSYFGFALDFFQDSKGSMNVVVGAPRANTSQPDVIEAGAVYLCPWKPNGSNCIPIEFDTKGDQMAKLGIVTMKTFKSKQWFGASVNTWKQSIVACAPLQHWNAIGNKEETTKTPVGSCFLATGDRQKFSEYSPCRNVQMHSAYNSSSGEKDKRYCEIGFSFTISQSGRLMLGAPGGYYFTGLFYSVALSNVEAKYPDSSSVLLWYVNSELITEDYITNKYDDGYQGYSVALGEFNEDSTSQEYVVGIPNMSLTQGAVEILTWTDKFHILWTISSEQVASYFGHTVAVADINGDGKDDLLVGAPLFMERRSDWKLYEVGRVYLYLQRRSPRPYRTPWQKLTGRDVYGRFGMAIAPLGDIDQDGYIDIAIGAPFAGKDGGGQVYIYCGHSEGLSASPSQILKSPFSESAGFGFAIRGASDIDFNGYPDVLVGAFRTNKVAVYRAQPMITLKAHLSIPDVLDSESKTCPGAQASCFNIQMCVRMLGKNIPSEIELNTELQLDHMKQKFGRRVLLLQTNQPSQLFQLKLSKKIPLTCKNVTAYLRDQADFKDKLSAIVVSLNFSLASFSRTGILQPILSGQLMVQEQTRIILDCGEDNICIPDLKLSAHTNEAFLLIGAENVVLIQITATNAGEGAYETELVAELPFGAYFQRANSSTQKLICNFRKTNETQLVSCEVGNPMKSHTEIKMDLELSISQLEDANSSIAFVLQLKSKNSQKPNSNIEWLQVPLKVDAQVELFGISIPATTVLPWTIENFKNKSNDVDDYGPKIEHIYRLQNAGPSTVSGADLLVYFPSHFWKGSLLYITRVSTEGNIVCLSTNETNPLKLNVQKPTIAPSNWHWRERRDVSFSTFKEHIEVNCSSQLCAVIHCQVGTLERGHGAMVTIHSVLWLPSFQEFPKQLLIQSRAQFIATGMPYNIQPEVLPNGAALAKTLVEWVNPDAERDIPIWWILTAVLVGLFLLAVFIIVLWKTGFFKRKRPPTEDEEQLTHDPGVQSAGEGQ
ncbi:integrin alpha-IIb isoform X1 [Pantherophis guttatus]|uniref:Integrin alpha-IIb isoform X1 n=1 Tax=Pantherophis guttatus TaxID=94885 RepID=A0A6P9BL09_PANGU|nr:integrin alpha-IIb isoform X1 [Pantherophis guttatus]